MGREFAHLLDRESLFLLIGGLESLPSLVGGNVTDDAIQGEQAVGLTFGGNMALMFAHTTHLRLFLRTGGLAMTHLSTAAALSAEFAFDGRVRAVGLVVTRLVTVVAETRVENAAALLQLLGAVAREMALGATAIMRQSWTGKDTFDVHNSLAASTVSGVLGDVLAQVSGVIVTGGGIWSPGAGGGGRIVGLEAAFVEGRCGEC